MIAKLKRCTPAPLIIRAVVFFAALAALLTSAPEVAMSLRVVLILAALSVAPALVPGSRIVDTVMLLTVVLWIVGTVGFGQSVTIEGTFATACALYLLHAAAALAAVLPYDSIVDGAVILRWAARSGMVIGVAGAVAVVIWLTVRSVTPGTSVLLLLFGLAAAGGIVSLLAWAARIRRRAL
jgi:hypothetical protein